MKWNSPRVIGQISTWAILDGVNQKVHSDYITEVRSDRPVKGTVKGCFTQIKKNLSPEHQELCNDITWED